MSREEKKVAINSLENNGLLNVDCATCRTRTILLPEMGNRISSEEDSSPVCVDVVIDPFGPSFERSLVSFEHFKSRMNIISFLIVIFSVTT